MKGHRSLISIESIIQSTHEANESSFRPTGLEVLWRSFSGSAGVYAHKDKEVGKAEGKEHALRESQSPGLPSLLHLGWYHSGVSELQGSSVELRPQDPKCPKRHQCLGVGGAGR